MAVSIAATLVGRLTSRVAAVALSNAAVASLDVLTVAHGLPFSPTMVKTQLRSVQLYPNSRGAPAVSVRSWNGSLVLIDFLPGPGATTDAASNILIDVHCEFTHSMVA